MLAVAGQVAGFAHLAVVRHVTCAEHGELIELGHASPAAVAIQPQANVVIAAAALGETHGHDHCLIAPMRRDRAALGGGATLDGRHFDADATCGHVSSRDIAPAIAIIRLAPKNSPPLV